MNRPLGILQVLEPSGGGSGRHFLDLTGALLERGHRVGAIYSPLRAEPRFIEELRALPLACLRAVPMTRAPSPSDLSAWWAISRLIRSEGPFDIVHAHSSKAGALTRLRMPGQSQRRVYTPHAFRTMDPTLGANGRRIFGGIESLLGRYFTDALVCVSDDEHRHAAAALGIPEPILHTIVNGVAPPPSGARDQIRARLGVERDRLLFGFVGRLSEQKAPERLIAAFGRVAAEFPEASLAMIGSGPLEADIRDRIGHADLGARVTLTGDITGPEAMQAFDILVMPSRYEAMSYVMLEAAAAGLPLILSDVGGASTVLEHSVNGLMVGNDDDPAALAGAMIEIASPEIRSRMAAAAQARSGRYSLAAMVDRTEELYRSLSICA